MATRATKKLQVPARMIAPKPDELRAAIGDYHKEHPIDLSIKEKLWPKIAVTGKVVTCYPDEGCELHVVTEFDPEEMSLLTTHYLYIESVFDEAGPDDKSYKVDFKSIRDNNHIVTMFDWTTGVATVTHEIDTTDETGATRTELPEPYTVQLTPHNIIAIPGQNVISCDDTQYTTCTVSYVRDPKVTLEELTNAILALGGNV